MAVTARDDYTPFLFIFFKKFSANRALHSPFKNPSMEKKQKTEKKTKKHLFVSFHWHILQPQKSRKIEMLLYNKNVDSVHI